jgi:cyclopropane-fatty-acyl-phospholipid synthase
MSTASHLPTPSVTAASSATPWTRLARKPVWAMVEKMLGNIACGSLHIQMPNGQVLHGKGATHGPESLVVIHRWKAIYKLATGGDIGLAESYMAGDWSTPDLTNLLMLGLANESHWQSHMDAGWLWRVFNRIQHLVNDNSRGGSKRNISFHYDLGNDFYRHWLDADLIYSSGIYHHPNENLEVAQSRKLQRIAELLGEPKAGVQPSILEIGCGWGALACQLAKAHDASLTGITLSSEQLRHAQERVRAEDLSQQVDLKLMDYRDLDAQYDHIVSIEMIEAVGERHWPTYFNQIRQCLKPGGRAVIQAITIAENHFDRYRSNADFIQKYIFPGGMLLTPQIIQSQSQQAALKVTHSETFGHSYAWTLRDWRERFDQAWPSIAPLGFDDAFKRLWEYYLCYCEAGFRSGKVDVGLYVLEHAGA